MKFSRIAVVLSLVGVVAFAQRAPQSASSSARPIFHGGGPVRGPVGGPRSGPVPAPRSPIAPSNTRVVIVPLYVGGGYYYGDPYAPGQQNVAPQQQQLQQDPPSVMINQGYQPEVQHPAFYDYSNVPLAPSPSLEERQSAPPPAMIQQQEDPAPTIYLIALKDGSIVAALGYWVTDDTLSYTTREGTENRVSIDRVDRDFSTKLNTDRQVDFKLP